MTRKRFQTTLPIDPEDAIRIESEQFHRQVAERTARLRPYVDFKSYKSAEETILEEAARLVNGPRRQEYGHPKDNFADIAKMWTVVLSGTDVSKGITSDQVILMMICLKVCRGKTGYKRDTAVDLAGYAQCWELINE